MIFTFENHPEEHGYFAADAFDDQIGKEVTVNADPLEGITGKIVSVEVREDGTAASITVEIPDDSPIARLLSGEGVERSN